MSEGSACPFFQGSLASRRDPRARAEAADWDAEELQRSHLRRGQWPGPRLRLVSASSGFGQLAENSGLSGVPWAPGAQRPLRFSSLMLWRGPQVSVTLYQTLPSSGRLTAEPVPTLGVQWKGSSRERRLRGGQAGKPAAAAQRADKGQSGWICANTPWAQCFWAPIEDWRLPGTQEEGAGHVFGHQRDEWLLEQEPLRIPRDSYISQSGVCIMGLHPRPVPKRSRMGFRHCSRPEEALGKRPPPALGGGCLMQG